MSNTQKQPVEYVSIDTYLASAQELYGLTSLQMHGFKAYMRGKHYLRNEMDFDKALRTYLGK